MSAPVQARRGGIMKKHRVGIVGLGWVAGAHIATFARGAELRNGELVLSTTLGVQNEGE